MSLPSFLHPYLRQAIPAKERNNRSADTYLTIRGAVYEKPDVGSRMLTTILTDEPIVTGNPFTEEWIAVNLPGKGGKGYMKRDFLIRLATAEQIEESGAELMRIGIPPRAGCIIHKKNRSNSKELSRLRGGIVLRVLSSDEETGMVKIKYDKSKTGYMKATDLPLSMFTRTTANLPRSGRLNSGRNTPFQKKVPTVS